MSLRIGQYLWRVLGFFAFNRIATIQRQRLPATGPVLFIATHRNGALDAAVYCRAVPQALALVSTQLQRSIVGRILFPGIAVARAKDRAGGMQIDNDAALEAAVQHIRAGGQLIIFPEGTSSLGPHHLPFKKGAARIAKQALARQCALTVVPMAVHYEAPTEWQSRVEILIGAPLYMQVGTANTIETLHATFTAALEAVGVNVATATAYRSVARWAYCATLGTASSYSEALKHFERRLGDELQRADLALEDIMQGRRPALHQDVPLVPAGSVVLYVLYWLLLTPWIVAGSIMNAPVLGAAVWASHRLPDATNVIAFWRMLVGTPAAILWAASVMGTLLYVDADVAALSYLLVSVVAVRCFYRWKKLSVALYNRWRYPELVAPLRNYHAHLMAARAQGVSRAA